MPAVNNPFKREQLMSSLVAIGVDAPVAEQAAKSVFRQGRPAPEATTAKLAMAQKHTKRAYGERNDVIAVLTRLFPSHHMPVTGNLEKLTNNRVICIHPPGVEPITWVVTEEEIARNFPKLAKEDTSHYVYTTREEKSARLGKITIAPAPKRRAKQPAKKKPAKKRKRGREKKGTR